MHKRLIILFLLVFSFALAEVSVIEIPLRYNYNYSIRAPGLDQFYYITRLPASGRVIAIPEDELARFLELAETNGFNDAQLGDLDYLPSHWSAVGDTAKATITIEHLGEMRFFDHATGVFIHWDDDHPAPIRTVNGVEITEWEVATLPLAPNPVIVREP